jgi:hypothetical protein
VVNLVENSSTLVSGTQLAADNDTNLIYVNGEVISYSACALSGQNEYTLSGYIRRGQFGTKINSHPAGSLVMRLDGSIARYTYDAGWQGKQVWFKFQPVNSFGNSATPLSQLTSVALTLSDTSGGAVDASTGLVVTGSSDTAGFGLTGKWWRGGAPFGGGELNTVPLFTTKDTTINYYLPASDGLIYNFANTTTPTDPPDGLGWHNTYVRWTGYLLAPTTGNFIIGTNNDDGCNLYVDGVNLFNDLGNPHEANHTDQQYYASGTVHLTAGELYPIVIEYYNGAGAGCLQLLWTLPNTSTPTLINMSAAYQHASSLSYSNGQTADQAQGLAHAGASESVVANGTFILGNDQGWSYITSTARTGLGSYDSANRRIVLAGALLESAATQSFQVVPGQKYRVTFDLAADNGTAASVYMRVTYSDTYSLNIPEGGGFQTDFFSGGTISTARSTYTYDWTSPAGVSNASLIVYNWTGGTSSIEIYGITCTPYGATNQWGADVTGLNTANNTNNVGDRSADDVANTVLAGGGIDYFSEHNVSFPQTGANLIHTGSFENGSSGAWGLTVVAISGESFTRAAAKTARDDYENGNVLPVTQGQILYVSAWLNTQNSASTRAGLGVHITGPGVGEEWLTGASLDGGQNWTLCEGFVVIPQGYISATPWLQLDYDGDGSQTMMSADLYIGTTPTGGYAISTPFKRQGGIIQTASEGIFNANLTDSTISVWSVGESLPFPDGSFIDVPATGSSGAPAWTFTGLEANTDYYFSGYYTIKTNSVHVIMSDVSGGKAPPSPTQTIQTINGDGNIGLWVGFSFSTTSPGGSGGGIVGPPPTCPAEDQLMETLKEGFIPAGDIAVGMHVRDAEDAEGDGWNLVHDAWSEEGLLHHITVSLDGVEETYHIDLHHRWLAPGGDSLADIYSENWLLSESLSVGDGVQGSDGRVYQVSAISEPHMGRYRKIVCERHRMRLGKLIGHNWSTSIPVQV